MKLVLPKALLGTGEGPKMAPGWVETTSRPAAARAMASSKAAILVRVYGSELGVFVTGASSRSSPPEVSKKVPVLTATTRPMSRASAASSTYRVPSTLTAWKSWKSWLAPPKRAAQWMAVSQPVAARGHRRPGDVAAPPPPRPGPPAGRCRLLARARARTGHRGRSAGRQTLAPVRPVAPVTNTVWLMRGPGRNVGVARVDLVGIEGDDRGALSEHVEGVDEAMQAHGVGAGEARARRSARR